MVLEGEDPEGQSLKRLIGDRGLGLPEPPGKLRLQLATQVGALGYGR
jgi:hypothetical protein